MQQVVHGEQELQQQRPARQHRPPAGTGHYSAESAPSPTDQSLNDTAKESSSSAVEESQVTDDSCSGTDGEGSDQQQQQRGLKRRDSNSDHQPPNKKHHSVGASTTRYWSRRPHQVTVLPDGSKRVEMVSYTCIIQQNQQHSTAPRPQLQQLWKYHSLANSFKCFC